MIPAPPSAYRPGQVLASRQKGAVLWVARVSEDRNRLQVIGVVEASATPTIVEPLTEPELRELLEPDHDDPLTDRSTSDEPDPDRFPA